MVEFGWVVVGVARKRVQGWLSVVHLGTWRVDASLEEGFSTL